jgi:hypothetical protein
MRLVLSRSLVRRTIAVFGLSVSMHLLELLDVSLVSVDGVGGGSKAVNVVCEKELSAINRAKGREEKEGDVRS